MPDLLVNYWPHILGALSLLTGTIAAVHAAMTKEDVRSAIGWVGVIVLSPLIGAAIYAVAGINRMRRASLAAHHLPSWTDLPDPYVSYDAGHRIDRRADKR